MNRLIEFINKITPPFLMQKRRWVILLFAVASLFMIFTRSCIDEHHHRKDLYIIGRDSTWFPLNVYGRDKNLIAFTNELISDIGQDSKLRFTWADTGASNLLTGLDDGYYDAVITSLRPDPFNQGKYNFSEPLLNTGLVLVVPFNTRLNSLKEIEGKTIGISSNSPLVFNAFKQGGANPLEITLINYSNINRGLEAVTTGKIDGILVESIPAYYLLDTLFKGKLHVVSNPLTDDGLRLVTLDNKAGEYLIKDVNASLIELKKSGAYTALIKKWSLFDPGSQTPKE